MARIAEGAAVRIGSVGELIFVYRCLPVLTGVCRCLQVFTGVCRCL